MTKNKILIVDDEHNLRETIIELLIHNNFDVKGAGNGQEALQTLEYWIPDLIISDIMMPVIDGYGFHEKVRETDVLSQLPFIFLTAKNEEKDIEKCTLMGVDHFIVKPFKIDELVKIINVKIERFLKIKNKYTNTSFVNIAYFKHEINTPLHGILGSIDFLINHKENLDQQKIDMFYNSIKTSGNRLTRTLHNSILFDGLNNNSLDLVNDSFSEILNEFLKVRNKIKKIDKSLLSRIEFDIDISDLKIEDEYLQFILFELLDNALKFSKADTKVKITGKIHDTEFYELTIQDFGIGFSIEQLGQINAFQQFEREKREQQGLGLGLFMSKIFIKRLKGVFTISSQKDIGTTITILIPIYAS